MADITPNSPNRHIDTDRTAKSLVHSQIHAVITNIKIKRKRRIQNYCIFNNFADPRINN